MAKNKTKNKPTREQLMAAMEGILAHVRQDQRDDLNAGEELAIRASALTKIKQLAENVMTGGQSELDKLPRRGESARKFHRYLVSVDVLTEDPITEHLVSISPGDEDGSYELDVHALSDLVNEGVISCKAEIAEHREVGAKEAAKTLVELGDPPKLFELTDEGVDVYEG